MCTFASADLGNETLRMLLDSVSVCTYVLCLELDGMYMQLAVQGLCCSRASRLSEHTLELSGCIAPAMSQIVATQSTVIHTKCFPLTSLTEAKLGQVEFTGKV